MNKNNLDKAEEVLSVPARTGRELISATRTLLKALPEFDENELEAFISIDSQTDHVDLGPRSAVQFPSTRISLEPSFGPNAVGAAPEHALGSSVTSIISPSQENFEAEMQSIFEAFGSLFDSERLRVLGKIRSCR